MIVSYLARIIKTTYSDNHVLKDTVRIYHKAVSFICDVVLKEWENIDKISTSKEQINFVEHLIHNTTRNKAKYNFDEKFYKFPSYFRRDAISSALGHISSHKNNLKNYEEKRYNSISNGLKFKEKAPTLNIKPNIAPSFYKDNMYIKEDDNTIKLKVYKNKDWVYHTFKLRNQDVKYINGYIQNGWKIKNPVLVFEYGKFNVRYSLEKITTKLTEKPLNERIILSVDLGINTDATCSVMKHDGTVIARYFINESICKDRMFCLLNRKRKKQKLSGNYKYAPQKKICNKILCYSNNIENKTSNAILKIALLHNVDVIVFERLSSNFKGKLSDKIHHWKKMAIIKKTCVKAHIYNIRYARVNPKNTSSLAFDGSGNVYRGINNNYSICKFTNGKTYNCDLNASYNIGARYFIREYLKSLSETEALEVMAKVPDLSKRTRCTLNTLITLNNVLKVC